MRIWFALQVFTAEQLAGFRSLSVSPADLRRSGAGQEELYLSLKSTIVRAHQQAAAGHKRSSENKALGSPKEDRAPSTNINLLEDEYAEAD
jgi:hypothetical protein